MPARTRAGSTPPFPGRRAWDLSKASRARARYVEPVSEKSQTGPEPDQPGPTYSAAGVDYRALDAGKRKALTEALATSDLLSSRGGSAVDESRGEPAFVFELGDETFAFVVEGLGTKSIVARQVLEELGENHFANVAYDTVAAIVNDICCVGALPLVVNAYFATGTSDWYAHSDRQDELLSGWRAACEDAGATWGGGESPSLPDLVSGPEIELAGSAIGIVPHGKRAILGSELAPGDEIVFVASGGLHANGSSLARLIAGRLPEGYGTRLPSGRTFGQALLDRSVIYTPLVEALITSALPVHYLSHITGHGLLKLMRPARELTYRITSLPDVPEVLELLVEKAEMSPSAAYSTFNMGCGYAIYCAQGSGEEVVSTASQAKLSAHVAGVVEDGPRRVILEQNGVTYNADALDLTPRRAA
jgi:phosphoribosylformylglycinamidine cyclo-ligase